MHMEPTAQKSKFKNVSHSVSDDPHDQHRYVQIQELKSVHSSNGLEVTDHNSRSTCKIERTIRQMKKINTSKVNPS